MKYHGNYCGPWWSAGSVQKSTNKYPVLPVDEFDRVCMEHDSRYATSSDLAQADADFIKGAFYLSNKANLAALAMVPQYLYRQTSRIVDSTMTKSTNKTNLRKTMVSKPPTRNPSNSTQANDSVRIAPVAYATTRTSTAPKMQNTRDGIVRLTHRAFIQPITSTSNYTATKVSCNPGLGGSFPWLSSLARKYDMYRFVKLRYSYRSVAATSTAGVVMFSFDYDAADDVPSNKAKQAQTVPCTESNCWTSLDLNVSMDAQWRYVRPGTLPSNLDVKTYDAGNLIYSTQYGSGIVTGELYVEYTVELKKPSDGVVDSGFYSSTTTAFATPFLTLSSSSGFLPFVKTSNTTIQFISAGEYLIIFSADGTGITAAASTPTISTSGSGAVATIFSLFTTTANTRIVRVRAEIGDYLTYANAGAGTTITGTALRVSLIDYDTMQ